MESGHLGELRVDSPRILLPGVWDMFHYGHAKAMEQIKQKYPKCILVIGIHSDATVLKMKGRVVFKYDERRALLNHIKWIDEILDDAPWYITPHYLAENKIDYLAGGTNHSKIENSIYLNLRDNQNFVPLIRIPSISTAIVLNRIIRNYNLFLDEFTNKESDILDIGIDMSKKKELLIKSRNDHSTTKRGLRFFGRHFRADGYIKKFGEGMLHTWNVLGTVKNFIIQTNNYKIYPAKNAKQESLADKSDNLKPVLHEIATKFVFGWQDLRINNMVISSISGGLTNRLFKISIDPMLAAEINELNAIKFKDHEPHVLIPHQILIKLYGPGTDVLFDRDNEHKIVQRFSDLEMGPKIYGIFNGGRVEEFLSLHSLKQNDLQKLAPLISQKLAEIHSSEIPGLSKSPSLFNSLWSWLKIVQDISFENEEKKAILDSLDVGIRLSIELELLEKELNKYDSPVVFCHNDLLGGNIMYDEETQKLCFIDYEYGTYNFRGFDIGNHFCERSITYNIPEYPHFILEKKKYPNKEQQKIFLRNYLKTFNNREASDEELSALMKEVNAFALASHFLWGLWAIIQATASDIQFGYMEFSKARFNAYYENKSRFLYCEDPLDDQEPEMEEIDNKCTFLEKNTHNFQKSHFNTPTWCGHCKFFIFQPFGKQGYRCMDCNMKIHQKCLVLVKSPCITTNPGSMWVEL